MLLGRYVEHLPEMFDPLELSVPVGVLAEDVEDGVEYLGVQLLSTLVLKLTYRGNILNPTVLYV